MKTNFLVSAHPKARIPGAQRLLVADPYVRHALEIAGEAGAYEEIAVAPASRTTREAFLRDHEFVDRKYRQYLPVLAERLNEVHGTGHEPRFWQKALSLSLLRHITFCFDLFQICEAHFRPQEHECRVLAESSFPIPDDFNLHRRLFQHTDLGREQLFASYCQRFHPGAFEPFEDDRPWMPSPQGVAEHSHWHLLQLVRRLRPRRVVRRLLRLRRPTMAIIRSYFSEHNLDRLLFDSRGRIQLCSMPVAPAPGSARDWHRRGALCRDDLAFDRFDRFVFASLRHAMPRAMVEDFSALCASHEAFLDTLAGVRWIVCEAWIGDAGSALLLSLASRRKIIHLYNEHNYLGHPFLGNNLKYIIPLVDEFATLGWSDHRAPNLVPAASLFPWTEDVVYDAPNGILFIGSIVNARAPEINASYGESGPVAGPSYLAMVKRFLGALSGDALRSMTFRDYPAMHRRDALHIDQQFVLRECLDKVASVDDSPGSARRMMRSFRLLVIAYLSTSYLEALIADIPTVVLWNRDIYHFDDGWESFFDGMATAGIFHSDPVEAAAFVDRIRHDPQTWWRSPTVRRAREEFLRANIGAPGAMISRLLTYANGRAPGATHTTED